MNTMNGQMNFRQRLQAGLSMIEVLVSLTIVAFGVLGLLGLQARALSFQKDSFDRRTAAEMVAQLAERIRANHMGLVNGTYNTATAPLYHLHPTTLTPVLYSGCVGTACDATNSAFRDWTQWVAEFRRRTAGSAAYIEWNGPADARSVLVTVAWPEPQNTAGADLVCNAINGRVAAGAIPANYRCYEAAVFP